MSANVYIIDQAGNRYDFPPDFWVKGDGWALNSNMQHLAFGMGGRDLSDNHLNHRTIMVEGAVRADSLTAFETKLRACQKAILAGGALYVSDDTVSRWIAVSNAMVDSEYTGDYRQEKNFTISFIAQDPFWQSAFEYGNETGDREIMTGVGAEAFTVDNSASDSIVYPLIRIDADMGADLPGIKIVNKNDGGMSFEYNDPYFTQGDYVEIDSYYGTVKRNGNDSFLYFITANFLRLQPMVNNFTYEGGAASVRVIYRRVYL